MFNQGKFLTSLLKKERNNAKICTKIQKKTAQYAEFSFTNRGMDIKSVVLFFCVYLLAAVASSYTEKEVVTPSYMTSTADTGC